MGYVPRNLRFRPLSTPHYKRLPLPPPPPPSRSYRMQEIPSAAQAAFSLLRDFLRFLATPMPDFRASFTAAPAKHSPSGPSRVPPPPSVWLPALLRRLYADLSGTPHFLPALRAAAAANAAAASVDGRMPARRIPALVSLAQLTEASAPNEEDGPRAAAVRSSTTPTGEGSNGVGEVAWRSPIAFQSPGSVAPQPLAEAPLGDLIAATGFLEAWHEAMMCTPAPAPTTTVPAAVRSPTTPAAAAVSAAPSSHALRTVGKVPLGHELALVRLRLALLERLASGTGEVSLILAASANGGASTTHAAPATASAQAGGWPPSPPPASPAISACPLPNTPTGDSSLVSVLAMRPTCGGTTLLAPQPALARALATAVDGAGRLLLDDVRAMPLDAAATITAPRPGAPAAALLLLHALYFALAARHAHLAAAATRALAARRRADGLRVAAEAGALARAAERRIRRQREAASRRAQAERKRAQRLRKRRGRAHGVAGRDGGDTAPSAQSKAGNEAPSEPDSMSVDTGRDGDTASLVSGTSGFFGEGSSNCSGDEEGGDGASWRTGTSSVKTERRSHHGDTSVAMPAGMAESASRDGGASADEGIRRAESTGNAAFGRWLMLIARTPAGLYWSEKQLLALVGDAGSPRTAN